MAASLKKCDDIRFFNFYQILILILVHVILTYTYDYFLFLGPLVVLFFVFYKTIKHSVNFKQIGFEWQADSYVLFVLGLILGMLAYNSVDFSNVVLKTSKFNVFYLILFVVFQTLAEDIVLGFILLIFFKKNIYLKLKPMYIIVLLSVFFSLHHFVFYGLNPFRYKSEYLDYISILSLFSFGFIRLYSMHYLKNISFSWGGHLGWNICFFSYDIYLHNKILTEPQKFDLVFYNSNIPVFLFVFVIVIVISNFNSLLR